MSEISFDRVAVLGLGAMGGSLARALGALDGAPTVVGWSPDGTEREAALEAGAVSSAPAEWSEAVARAQLVVLAAPLGATCRMVDGVVRSMEPGATLTDVASLKAPVAAAVADAGAMSRWVGSHPMTGSQESGFAASRAGLYRGATVWTVADAAAEERVDALHSLWRALGARPVSIEADEHDRLMALVSHLPQLTSNVLASVLDEDGVSCDRLGPGGADMTRLAASSPRMWRDVFEHASPELIAALRTLAARSTRVADLLEGGELDAIEALMTRTRAWRADA